MNIELICVLLEERVEFDLGEFQDERKFTNTYYSLIYPDNIITVRLHEKHFLYNVFDKHGEIELDYGKIIYKLEK